MKAKQFVVSACVILAATGLAKIISAQQPVSYLNLKDPLFEFLTNRQLLLGTAAVELTVVVLVIWLRDRQQQLVLIAWLSSMFLLYRISIHLLQPTGSGNEPCPCLGNAAAWLAFDVGKLDQFAKVLLGYLLLGSYGLLISYRLRKPNSMVVGKNDVLLA